MCDIYLFTIKIIIGSFRAINAHLCGKPIMVRAINFDKKIVSIEFDFVGENNDRRRLQIKKKSKIKIVNKMKCLCVYRKQLTVIVNCT